MKPIKSYQIRTKLVLMGGLVQQHNPGSQQTATRKLKFQHSLARVLEKNTEPEEEQQHTVLVISN